MKNKFFFGAVSSLLLLGAGCTYLQDAGTGISIGEPSVSASPTEAVLLQDKNYGVEFVTSPQCKSVFRVTQERVFDCDTLGVQDNIPTVGGKPECVRAGYYLELASPAVRNPKFFTGRRFAVISRWLYDRIDHEELPGTPRIHEALDNDLLLTSYDPNGDVFEEANTCEWKVRKITQ